MRSCTLWSLKSVGRRALIAVAALALTVPPARLAAQSAEVLTNDQVVQMVVGKLPRELILAKVRGTRPGFDVTSAGLVRLTTSHVHREIIKAMIGMMQDARANGTAVVVAGEEAEVLSNDAIMQMVAGDVDREIIDLKLRNTRSAFDLSAAGLVRLNERKVPSDLIKSMMAPPLAPPPPKTELTIREAPSASATVVASPSSSATKTPDVTKTTVAAVPRKPKPALAAPPSEPGIYLRASDLALTPLERNQYVAGKTSGLLKNALTGGIAKAKTKAVVSGAEASIRTKDASVEFYFVFEQSKASLGGSAQAWGLSLTSPNEFSLVRLEQKDTRREVTTGSANAFGMQAGTDDKDVVPFTFTKIKTGVYRVIPKSPLDPGEYGFFPASAGGQGTAGSSRLFDFGVGVP